MYNNILVPVAFDHLHFGEKSIAVAKELLNPDGRIFLIHVMEDIPRYIETHLPEGILEANRSDAVAKLNDLAESAGKNCMSSVLRGHAKRVILSFAAEHGVDCIVIASHKPGIEDYFLGSTAAHVVRHAKCCVHVLR